MGFSSELAANIKAARKAAGWTQAEMAMMIGTSQAAMASYEAGRRMPRLVTMARICMATDQEIGDLVPEAEPDQVVPDGQMELVLDE